MDHERLSPERKEAFLRLLDDPNPGVRKAMLEEFSALGGEGAGYLKSVAEGENRVLAIHASWYLRQLKYSDPAEEFRVFIRSLHYELETGALLMNRTVVPDLDVGESCRLLDEIAGRCTELMFPPMSVRQKCRVINRVLFHEYAFRGNVENYTDPRNSFLSEVLQTRRGLPITLSIVYILVAQRCGLTLEPVGLPGHFLVGCYEEKPAFFVDAFARGAFRSPEDLFEQLRKKKMPPKLSYLAPTPVREVLCRCCRNLASHYTMAKEPKRARLFASFVNEFEVTYHRNVSS
ncbi:MAG: transglutaminase-like domain-containing protein [Opitutales bacterium]